MSAPKFMAIHQRVVETFPLKLAQPHGGARGTADDRQSRDAVIVRILGIRFSAFPFILKASSRAMHSGCIFKHLRDGAFCVVHCQQKLFIYSAYRNSFQ